MTTRLTGSVKRVFALIILGTLILTGLSAIAVPLWLGERQASSRMIIEARIEEIKHRLVEQKIVLDELDEREHVDRLGPYLLTAPTVSLAAVEMARHIIYLLEVAEGLVTSTEVLEPVRVNTIWQVGVRLRATVEISGLRRLLYDIEGNSPLLSVERLVVQRFDKQRNSHKLQLEIVVVGYTRKNAPPA